MCSEYWVAKESPIHFIYYLNRIILNGISGHFALMNRSVEEF